MLVGPLAQVEVNPDFSQVELKSGEGYWGRKGFSALCKHRIVDVECFMSVWCLLASSVYYCGHSGIIFTMAMGRIHKSQTIKVHVRECMKAFKFSRGSPQKSSLLQNMLVELRHGNAPGSYAKALWCILYMSCHMHGPAG